MKRKEFMIYECFKVIGILCVGMAIGISISERFGVSAVLRVICLSAGLLIIAIESVIFGNKFKELVNSLK